MTKEDSRLFANLNVDEFSGQAWSSKMFVDFFVPFVVVVVVVSLYFKKYLIIFSFFLFLTFFHSESGVGVLTHRWNKLVRWVASEVVNCANQKQRTEILKRFIIILDDVFKSNNFFAAMAVLSGLNHSAVQRMKKTWRGLPEKYMRVCFFLFCFCFCFCFVFVFVLFLFLFCFVLFCFVLFCFVLFCFVLFCMMSC